MMETLNSLPGSRVSSENAENFFDFDFPTSHIYSRLRVAGRWPVEACAEKVGHCHVDYEVVSAGF